MDPKFYNIVNKKPLLLILTYKYTVIIQLKLKQKTIDLWCSRFNL